MRSTARVLTLATVLAAVCGTAVSETYWIAAAAHLSGAAGTRWRTDLAVLNPCDRDVTVELRLRADGAVFEQEFIVPAGEQQLFPDVVDLLGGGEVKGSLEVTAVGDVVVSSRTYNQSGDGTFGQALDGHSATDMAQAGDVLFLQQLREDGEFRSNIGVLNAGRDTALLTAELYDRHGVLVGSFRLAVAAGRALQDDRPFRDRFGRSDILAGYARLVVERGSAVWPYASVVDNRTGDPTTVEPDPEPSCLPDIAVQLAAIEGMTAEERATGLPGYRLFELLYDQPADHARPDGERFAQRMLLLHRSYDAPVVLNTQGYDLWGGRTEVAVLLNANQIQVEHRFFGESVPATVDWSLLTIEQAAADHHRIVEALKPIYGGAWINTGYSKGGMTATYHRRFYPDDVDATVAYVAPLSLGAPDDRYLDFLASVGTPECNQQLRAIQRETLARRDAMLDRLAARTDLSFERIGGIERGFESIVIEIPFTFWQYAGQDYCSQIPATTASDTAIFNFVDAFVGWDYAADAVFEYFEAYYYQAQSELGFPAVARDHLADLLVTDAPDPEQGVPPAGSSPVYDPAAMPDVAQWVASEGERLMFVYGEFDPWTGGAYELGGASDSHLFVEPAGTHGATIASLEPDDRDEAVEIISRWAGVPIVKHLPAPEADLHPPWRREVRPLSDTVGWDRP